MSFSRPNSNPMTEMLLAAKENSLNVTVGNYLNTIPLSIGEYQKAQTCLRKEVKSILETHTIQDLYIQDEVPLGIPIEIFKLLITGLLEGIKAVHEQGQSSIHFLFLSLYPAKEYVTILRDLIFELKKTLIDIRIKGNILNSQMSEPLASSFLTCEALENLSVHLDVYAFNILADSLATNSTKISSFHAWVALANASAKDEEKFGAHLEKLLSQNKSIRHLILDGPIFRKEEFQTPLEKGLASNQTITHLELYDYRFEFTAALKENHSLLALNLHYPEVKGSAVSHLRDALKCNSSLLSLALRLDSKNARQLPPFLIKNTGLENLSLYGSELKENELNILAISLSKNITLQKLSLGNTALNDSLIHLFFEELNKNPNKGLCELNVSTNSITLTDTNTVKTLSEFIDKHPRMSRLNLDRNQILRANPVFEKLLPALNQAKQLRVFSLNANPWHSGEIVSIVPLESHTLVSLNNERLEKKLGIHQKLIRNKKREHSWSQVALLIAFYRGNRDSSLRTSIFALLPVINALKQKHALPQTINFSKFPDTVFFKAEELSRSSPTATTACHRGVKRKI